MAGEKVPANIRLLHILEVLMRDIIHGMSIQEIADILNEKYHTIHRDLGILQEYGYVKEDKGRYVADAKFMGLGLAFYEQMQKAQNSLLLIQQESVHVAQKLSGVIYEYGNN